jgi:PPM family protein phosphatase
MEAEIVAISRDGGRSYNEDVYGHWNDGRYIACIVSDGAGGHGGGTVASETVKRTVLELFAKQPSVDGVALREIVEQANFSVVARQGENEAQSAMRATVVLAAIDIERKEMVWVHCGDSRAYLFRDDKVIARTKDHSLVQQMVDGGLIDDEAARLHPTRNLLLSALGSVDEPLEVSVSEVLHLKNDDVILLCSDGIWEPLGDALITEKLSVALKPSLWLESLDLEIKQFAKPNHDNYTALTLWTSSSDEITQIVPAVIKSSANLLEGD